AHNEHPDRVLQSGHSCLGSFGRKVCSLSAGADIYFPLYVPPLRRAAQSADHLLKGIGVFGGVLEPSQEVEWLSKFSAVMQTSRYGRQVFHTNSNVRDCSSKMARRSSCAKSHQASVFRIGMSAARVACGLSSISCLTLRALSSSRFV